ncbi:MAG: RDD family protein [Actinomycetota bacterium]|nr:RDD family protein [Actinomycetota bacterium]
MTSNTDPAGDGLFSRVFSRATGVVVDAVDPDTIIDSVDVNALMERVDVNALLDRVDPQVILDNVDVNTLMDRVDVDALLDRVDVDALMSRVDIDALLDRVDVKELTDRAGIPDIVRESTGALAGSAMDVVRRQIVALDQIVGSASYRVIGRHPSERPVAPKNLEAGTGIDEDGHGQVTGHYAGPISRLAAYVLDALILWASYLLTLMGFTFVIDFVFQIQVDTGWESGIFGVLLGALWGFIYYFASWAFAGRTIGMAIIGLSVTSREGSTISGKAAFIRALAFPISFMIFGLGFVGLFTSPERRSLHDSAAGTVVVYDWGDRPAEMSAPLTRWVNRRMEDED